jgi:thiol-disulfide isomerase/thioredoxin
MSQFFIRTAAAIVATTALAAPAVVRAQTLGIGDPAPALTVKEFVKGKPVSIEKGKLYVVEFWATWCGPCKVSIPHLTELAKQNKNVTFVGVSVWEQDQGLVKPFVTQMGPKMDYCVATDVVPAGGKGNEGTMAKTWMTASGQNGIPTAFIIDKDSKIAWIGHPMAMEKPLADISAGKWDITAAAAKYKAEKASEMKLQALGPKMQAAMKESGPKGAVSVIDAAVAEDASLEAPTAMTKFVMLYRSGDAAGAATYGTRIVETVSKDSASDLNELAWFIVDPASKTKPSAEVLKVAVMAAEKADKLSGGKDGAIADTLALAYFDSGDAKKALATQERALKLSGAEADESMKQRLAQYKAAAGK